VESSCPADDKVTLLQAPQVSTVPSQSATRAPSQIDATGPIAARVNPAAYYIANTLAHMIIQAQAVANSPLRLSLYSTQGPSTRPSSVVSSVVEGSIAGIRYTRPGCPRRGQPVGHPAPRQDQTSHITVLVGTVIHSLSGLSPTALPDGYAQPYVAEMAVSP
jgi:hypothetical protein